MKKVVSAVILTFSFVFFNSCNNFLNSSELKEKISDQVDAASAPLVPVFFESGKGGDVDPKGIQQIKLKQEFSVSYLKDEDYQFKNWQVFLNDKLLTAQEAGKYVEIDNESNTTTNAKILKNIEGLKIKPLCFERPVVLSKSPVEQTEGSYRDAKIFVNFSQKMDESSIYYESEEEVPSGYSELLKVTVEGEEKIYGYKKDGIPYFKNIEIKNLNTEENYLNHFENPVFETPNRLAVSVKKENYLPKTTQVLVTVSKNMCTKENKINLKSNLVWNYFTHGRIDDTGPIINNIELRNKKLNENEYSKLSKNITFSGSKIKAADVQELYLSNDKIAMYIDISDYGSGPETAYLKYKRIYDETYSEINSGNLKEKLLSWGFKGKNTASIHEDDKTPGEISLEDDEDGLYECYFEFKDGNGNSTRSEETYYVLKDKTGPSGTGKMKLASGKNSVSVTDYSASEEVFSIDSVTYTNKTQCGIDQKITKTLGNAGNSFEITDLQNTSLSVYELDVEATDIFGNEGTSTVTVITQPDAPNVEITPDNFYYTGINDAISKLPYYEYEIPGRNMKEGHKVPKTVIYGHTINGLTQLSKNDTYETYYVVYDGDKCIGKGDNQKVTIQTTTTGLKKYKIAIAAEVNGTVVVGQKKDFDYYETGADLFFVKCVLGSEDINIYLTFGYVNPKFTFSRTSYKKEREGETYLSKSIESKDTIYYVRDFCTKKSVNFIYWLYDYNSTVTGKFTFTANVGTDLELIFDEQFALIRRW